MRIFEVAQVASEVRGHYDHILVDEFQDINYASGRLVWALDGGRGIVWAVGDPRQSIFRFRGASPINLRSFTEEYPNAQVITLETNYRSIEDIVEASQTVQIPQPTDGKALDVPRLHSHRGRPSQATSIELVIAPTGRDEVTALVEKVEEITAVRPYGDVAVLCRVGTQAQEISDALEKRRIPTDWSSALEKRAAFKDIAGVLLLATDDPQGIVRLARMPEHFLDEGDLRRLLATAKKRGHSALAALCAAVDGEIEGLGEAGALQAARLKHLAGELGHKPSPWLVMASYLFEHATWPRQLFGDTSPEVRRLLATLGQVASLAREFAGRGELAGGSDTRAFLEFLRLSLEAGELATSDEALVGIEVVHILTVHSAKGLEWPVVFVPNLAVGRFPHTDNHPPLPLPPGLVRGADLLDGEIEEACLLYVAITRARDFLVLSRAEKYSRNQAAPAPLLAGLIDALQPAGFMRTTVAPTISLEPAIVPVSTRESWHFGDEVPFRALDLYEKCPMEFKYERIYRLSDNEQGSLNFHTVVQSIMRWAAERTLAGEVPSEEAVITELAARWTELGPSGHWFEGVYRRRAEHILADFVRRLHPNMNIILRQNSSLPIDATGGKTLRMTLDEVEDDGTLRIYRRHHFNRPAKSHRDEHHLALFTAIHRHEHGDAPFQIRLYYPLIGSDEPIDPPTQRVVRNRVTKMAKLVAEIEAGQFAEKHSQFHCPSCPFIFLCPA